MSESESSEPLEPDEGYRAFVLERIAKGLRDIEQGRFLEPSEVELRMARWLRDPSPEGEGGA